MSVLDAFLSTWSNARATFGEGVPQPGTGYDQSAPLTTLKSDLDQAAPGTHWSGGAATVYGNANTEHQRVIGELGGLDRRLAAKVDQSAQIVAAGRQDLDAVRKWVLDAAASVPKNRAGEQMLVPIVSRGLGRLSDIVTRRNGELSTVGGDIRTIGSEYQALGTDQKFAADGDHGDNDGEDDGEDAPEESSAAEQGRQDSEALQDGTLTDEQRQRLAESTTLTAQQQSALDEGNLTMPPEQMSYLQGFSQAFGDKTPSEIKADMQAAGPDGARVADAFQLASNPTITTGLPGAEPPSVERPAAGGEHALPDGVRQVLDGPALTQPFSDTIRDDNGNVIVHGEPTGPLQPTKGLDDLADIVQSGNRDLQVGTDLDRGLMAKGQEMLEQSNRLPIEQAPGPGFGPLDDGPRWYHEHVDPTLQNMFNAVNADDVVVHDVVTGPGGGEFLDDLTKHQWQDDGLAAGGLFDWVAETAQDDPTGRAASTAHALAEYTSGHQPQLLNLAGTDGQSLGQVNPELTRDLSRVFAPYLDDMVGNNIDGTNDRFFPPLDGAEEQPLKTRALMSVMYSDDQAAEHLYRNAGSTVEHYLERAATSITDQDPTSDNMAMKAAGRLQSALDLGSFDESYDRLQDGQQALQDSYQRRSALFAGAAGLVSTAPVVGSGSAFLSPYLQDLFVGAAPAVDATVPTTPPRDAFPMQVRMAEVLIHHELGDAQLREWVQGQVGSDGKILVPSHQHQPNDYNILANKISSFFEDIRGANTLMENYWESYAKSYTTAEPSIGGQK
ncbi:MULTISPECIES: EspA/EspE family type VII secretion system effector [Mycobacteriaceae]|uniref:Uncharacterized protein n=1 Tax=Mycolicibacterium parafortuitum TaxID=39692 RepID=A0ACC6MNI9_MYCPF|nr:MULTISPECIES: EspA/EspE family type VII secretion system effector [Mycobacteriaceae]MDZ5088577.1 hypothetical protein [Mycolicibacterium parafortuitum]GFM16338.1 uncharacterized protein PO1_contig-005-97 [Mycobacterium sp. PO1]GFM25790.1 uncharacterized protein PO2_contig-076-20 [Mycobacterium sp. PO2]